MKRLFGRVNSNSTQCVIDEYGAKAAEARKTNLVIKPTTIDQEEEGNYGTTLDEKKASKTPPGKERNKLQESSSGGKDVARHSFAIIQNWQVWLLT